MVEKQDWSFTLCSLLSVVTELVKTSMLMQQLWHTSWHVIAERLSARQLILLRISFCVRMYVCMSVTLRNANIDTLRMCISVSCMGRAQRMWPHYCRERHVEHKKTMHADAMDGSISTEDEDSD